MPTVGVSDKRRQQLIRATVSLVVESGLQHTTLHHSSAQAGMSSGIISHCFGGKQALIGAVALARLCARAAAQQSAAMIDGFWLRRALSPAPTAAVSSGSANYLSCND